ncbi:MAG: Gfo/Idh/MocA family oxidoreductase [Clostridiales bacterium]|jgi:predicted dehydrogenase|nr:Gfo/Idh/MocA family oxidoreductase [Clostridiales bacterium]
MFSVIVAGCGSIVNKWFENALAREDVKITAVVDPIEKNAVAHKERYGLNCPVFGNISEAFGKVEANLVFNTTPPAMHEEIIISALMNGLDVFTEKPLADSVEAARDIILAADETGRKCFVLQNRRYLYGIRTLRSLIEKEAVGKPFHISVDMLLGAHFTGFRNEMEHPLLLDMSIHTFDEARYLLGDVTAVSAYCQEYNPPHSWYRGEGAADAIFEMSGGTVISFRGSWIGRAENTSSHGRWTVSCGEGAAVWDGYRGVWLNEAQPVRPDAGYYEEEGLRREIALLRDGREEHDGCLDAMFNALKTGRAMQTDCHNNIHSLAMTRACIKSSVTGEKVML